MKTYFCLSEDYSNEHIGVVFANEGKTLNLKIKDALESHFNCEILPFKDINFEEILSSYLPFIFNIELINDPITIDIRLEKTRIY